MLQAKTPDFQDVESQGTLFLLLSMWQSLSEPIGQTRTGRVPEGLPKRNDHLVV